MVTATHIFQIIFQILDKAIAPLQNIDKNMQQVRKSTDQLGKAAKGTQGKLLGLGLGLTFFMFGIQIQLKRLLRTSFQFFKEAQGETGALITQFNILRANLGGIAIAFFDALAGSKFLQFIIDQVIRVRKWFLNLSDTTREWLAASTFTFLGIVSLLSFIGQFVLAWTVLKWLPVMGRAGKVVTAAAAGNTAVKAGFLATWLTMTNLIAGGLIIFAGFKIKDALFGEKATLGDIIIASLAAGLGTGLIFGAPAGFIASGVVLITLLTKRSFDDANAPTKSLADFSPSGPEIPGTSKLPFGAGFGNFAINFKAIDPLSIMNPKDAPLFVSNPKQDVFNDAEHKRQADLKQLQTDNQVLLTDQNVMAEESGTTLSELKVILESSKAQLATIADNTEKDHIINVVTPSS